MDFSAPNLGREDWTPRDMLCDELLFGAGGFAVTSYPSVRGHMYLLLDDGWDVLPSLGRPESVWLRPYLSSCQLSEEKFPGYGETPAARLTTLVQKVKALGWRGLGVWICPQVGYGADVVGRDLPFADYWRIRLEWARDAGVSYWKIDWGAYDLSDKHKRELYALRDEIYPALIMENAYCRHPRNTRRNGQEGGLPLTAQRWRLSYSDVLRTYDVAFPLSIPTTLSRVAALLRYPTATSGLINAEDELYLCAALGLAAGVMRYDIGTLPDTAAPNMPFGGTGAFPPTRPARHQLDEVARALRWLQKAPAFPVNQGGWCLPSEERNQDRWAFKKDEIWEPFYKEDFVMQSAPRVLARNVSRPTVTTANGEAMPYVVASQHPNGALSIATLGRVTPERGYWTPHAKVTWDLLDLCQDVGIFGHYDALVLFTEFFVPGVRVLAGDLLGDTLEDITERISIVDGTSAEWSMGGGEGTVHYATFTLPGTLLEEIGTALATPGDKSEPGVWLRFVDKDGQRFVTETLPEKRLIIPIKPPHDGLYRAILRIMAFGRVCFAKIQHKRRLRP
jgi:hypothetical protein